MRFMNHMLLKTSISAFAIVSVVVISGSSYADVTPGPPPNIIAADVKYICANNEIIPKTLANTGAAQHVIKIVVPPGRHGVQPDLSLVYNSQADNGWVGVGWDLSLGYIQRSTKHGLDYASNDYVVNGSDKLVFRSGSTYGLEIESEFTKYLFLGAADGWIATTRDGTEYHYGRNPNSRQQNGNGVFKWCLNQIKDTNGNYLTVTYDQSHGDGQIYLSQINYTYPNNNKYITFTTESRTDVISNFNSYSEVQTTRRLKTIKTYLAGSGSPVRTYTLEYEQGTYTDKSRLKSIQESGGGATLPKVDFQYYNGSDGNIPLQQNQVFQGMFVVNDDHIFLNDISGDGLSDIIIHKRNTSGGNTMHTYFSNGNGTFQYKDNTRLDGMYFDGNDHILLNDINGDGLADIVFHKRNTSGGNTVYTFFSDGNGEFDDIDSTRLDGLYLYEDDHIFLNDLNGDGLADILIHMTNTSGGDTVHTYFSDGSGEFDEIDSTLLQGLYLDEEDHIFLNDINGDGLTDIAIHISGTSGGDTVYTYLSDGNGAFEYKGNTLLQGLYLDNTDRIFLNDVNGDGLADIILHMTNTSNGSTVHAYLSDGNGSFQDKGETLLQGLYYHDDDVVSLSDINADGLTDIIIYKTSTSNGNTIYTYFSDGNGSFEYKDDTFLQGLSLGGDDNVFLNNINGDGLADVIIHKTNLYGGDSLYACFNTTTPTDYLTSINNNVGARSDLAYSTEIINQNKPNTFITNTLSSITTTDLIDNNKQMITRFNYTDGYYNLARRELRGFYQVTTTNPDNSTERETYNQGITDYFYKSRKTEELLSFGSAYVRTVYTWQKESHGTWAFVKLGSKLTQYDSAANYTSEVYGYNSTHGSLTSSTTSGTSAETITTAYNYTNVNGGWRWRVSLETVTGTSSGLVRRTDNTYDTNGNLRFEEHYNDTGDNPITERIYDTYGNVSTLIDPNGNTTTYAYESTFTYPKKITYPQTGSTIHEIRYPAYDYRFGKPISKIDENGNETTYAYDWLGRPTLIETRNPANDVKGRVSAIYYDNTDPRYASVRLYETLSSYIDTYTWFDGFGRQYQTRTSGENKLIYTTTTYDTMGRKYRVQGPYFAGDTKIPFEQTLYDYRDRPVQITTYDGSGPCGVGVLRYAITNFSHSGFTTTVQDPDAKQKTEVTDHLGRIIQVVEHGVPTPTAYAYNAAGDLLRVTYSTGSNMTEIQYDTLGRKTYMDDPDMGIWTYDVYDKNGNLKVQANPAGETTYFDYDELNRITRKYYSTTDPEVTYEYDLASVPNSKGRLCKIINPDATISYNEYDAMGRVQIESKIIDATTYTTQNTYDLAGKLLSMEYPGDNYVLNYEYYPGTGLLYRVLGDSDSFVYAQYSNYSPSGKIGNIQYGNNTSHSFAYDPYSTRLMSYVTQGAGEPLQNKSYVYSLAGDISSVTDNLLSNTHTYSYDNLHRLTSETSDLYSDISYVYTNIGNIESKTIGANTSSYTYTGATGGGPHAVSTVTGQLGSSYNFSERTIDYNVESMPVSIVDIMEDGITTQTTLFEYDGNNTRVKKDAPNGIETYYIGNHYEVHNGQATKYIFGNNMRIAQVKGTEKHFFHKDHLMSSTVMSDEDGQKVEYTEYMPFGKTRSHVGQDISDYKFTDQELDKSTGFYNYDARLYDPLIGRFIIADSIVPDWFDPQALNRYSYVRNNPLIYIDPDGRKLYNVAIKGSTPMGHNLTMHIDDKTGKVTYYEVTGRGFDQDTARVYKRSKEEFIEHYKERIPELDSAKFDEKKSLENKDYLVVEVKEVNEDKVLKYMNKMHEEFREGKDKYAYEWNEHNCTSFGYESYKIGGKEYTKEPGNSGENPYLWPRDLNQAIEYHNSVKDKTDALENFYN